VSPGELVVEIGRGGVMYVHCLDLRVDPQELWTANRRREALLKRITE
jgi:multisubunit Na+/H+ antiporter MnhE subunit